MKRMLNVENGYFLSQNELREIFFGLDALRKQRDRTMFLLQENIENGSYDEAALPALQRSLVVAVEAWRSVCRLQYRVSHMLKPEIRNEPSVMTSIRYLESTKATRSTNEAEKGETPHYAK